MVGFFFRDSGPLIMALRAVEKALCDCVAVLWIRIFGTPRIRIRVLIRIRAKEKQIFLTKFQNLIILNNQK